MLVPQAVLIDIHHSVARATHTDPHASLSHDGLWLLALGAVLLIVGLSLAGTPHGLNGMAMGIAKRTERVGWAFNVTGALSIVIGSVLVAIGNWPSPRVLIGTGVVALIVAVLAYIYSGRARR